MPPGSLGVVYIAAFVRQEHLHALLKVMVHLPFPNIFAAWPTPLMPNMLETAMNNSQVYHSGSEAKTVIMTDYRWSFPNQNAIWVVDKG